MFLNDIHFPSQNTEPNDILLPDGFISIQSLLDLEFTTPSGPPIANPYVGELGQVTAVQNDGQFTVSNGQLQIPAQTTPAYGDLSLYTTTAWPRQAGLAVLQFFENSTATLATGLLGAFRNNSAGSYNVTGPGWTYSIYGVQPFVGDFYRLNNFLFGVMGIVLQTTGAIFITENRIIWVDRAENKANLYWSLVNYTTVATLNYVRAVQFLSVFNQTDSLALHVDATPTSGDTAVGSNDGLIYFTWTPGAGEVLNIRYRWVNDDNCMILRFNQASSNVQLIRRSAGVETVRATTGGLMLTVGTPYPVYVRYEGRNSTYGRAIADVDQSGSVNDGFQFDKTGVKVDGFVTGSNWLVYPRFLSSAAQTVYDSAINPYLNGAQTRQTISVADGGNISAAIATMRRGDILSLAPNGTYNIAGGATGISTFPNGISDSFRTEIRGNGATIVGGSLGMRVTDREYFKISDLNFLDQTSYCHQTIDCRNFEFDNCTFRSTASASFADSTHFERCVNFIVRNCVAGPSTGVGSCDGFECYGECLNGQFINCEANDVVNGFEVWTGVFPSWVNVNISFLNCDAHDCRGVGYSVEGGVQALAHVNIVADGCIASNNALFDYEGIDGSTLIIRNYTGGTTNGSVDIQS